MQLTSEIQIGRRPIHVKLSYIDANEFIADERHVQGFIFRVENAIYEQRVC